MFRFSYAQLKAFEVLNFPVTTELSNPLTLVNVREMKATIQSHHYNQSHYYNQPSLTAQAL